MQHGHMNVTNLLRCNTVTCHDARSHERNKFVTMQHGHMNLKRQMQILRLVSSPDRNFEIWGFSSSAHKTVGTTHLSWQEDGAEKWVSLQVEHQDLWWADGQVVLEGGDDATVHHPQSVTPVYSNPVGWHQARAVSCRPLPFQARIRL